MRTRPATAAAIGVGAVDTAVAIVVDRVATPADLVRQTRRAALRRVGEIRPAVAVVVATVGAVLRRHDARAPRTTRARLGARVGPGRVTRSVTQTSSARATANALRRVRQVGQAVAVVVAAVRAILHRSVARAPRVARAGLRPRADPRGIARGGAELGGSVDACAATLVGRAVAVVVEAVAAHATRGADVCAGGQLLPVAHAAPVSGRVTRLDAVVAHADATLRHRTGEADTLRARGAITRRGRGRTALVDPVVAVVVDLVADFICVEVDLIVVIVAVAVDFDVVKRLVARRLGDQAVAPAVVVTVAVPSVQGARRTAPLIHLLVAIVVVTIVARFRPRSDLTFAGGRPRPVASNEHALPDACMTVSEVFGASGAGVAGLGLTGSTRAPRQTSVDVGIGVGGVTQVTTPAHRVRRVVTATAVRRTRVRGAQHPIVAVVSRRAVVVATSAADARHADPHRAVRTARVVGRHLSAGPPIANRDGASHAVPLAVAVVHALDVGGRRNAVRTRVAGPRLTRVVIGDEITLAVVVADVVGAVDVVVAIGIALAIGCHHPFTAEVAIAGLVAVARLVVRHVDASALVADVDGAIDVVVAIRRRTRNVRGLGVAVVVLAVARSLGDAGVDATKSVVAVVPAALGRVRDEAVVIAVAGVFDPSVRVDALRVGAVDCVVAVVVDAVVAVLVDSRIDVLVGVVAVPRTEPGSTSRARAVLVTVIVEARLRGAGVTARVHVVAVCSAGAAAGGAHERDHRAHEPDVRCSHDVLRGRPFLGLVAGCGLRSRGNEPMFQILVLHPCSPFGSK